jgi:hypothetical protein
MNRRELLTLGINRKTRSIELSCERLYMKFCDSQLNGTTQELFERLEIELQGVEHVLLVDSAWLASREFRQHLESLLFSIRARGGRVTHFSGVPKSSSCAL